MDVSQFRRYGKEMVDFIADYLENIRDRQVFPSVQPGYIRELIPAEAPQEAESWEDVMKDIERVIMPGMTHWHSPHFHAYYPTANSFPALCGDMLSGAFSCIGFTWSSSPACTELEMMMMDWLGKMLGLPEHFFFSSGGRGGGVIQGTVSDSTLIALLTARTQAIAEMKKKCHNSDREDAGFSKLVAYASEQSHCSVEKAGMLGGVKMRLLPTDDNFSLRGETLASAIKEDRAKGQVPFMVTVTLGTTSSCAFDNLLEIGQICEKEKIWLHVDAAYAGAAFVCPEYRYLMKGAEYANSLAMNPHKALLVNFDCSALWMKDRYVLENAFNVAPVYLRHEKEGQIPDYRHWQVPLGRRFRSLKMWFVFRMYGVKGLQEHIRKQIALAQLFEKCVREDARFEVMATVIMGLVCFRLKGSNERNEMLLKRINERRKIHLTPTKLRDQYVIRFAVCAASTATRDVEFAWREITEVAGQILKEMKTQNGSTK